MADYANKFGLTNVLSDEEKSSYRAFAQRVHNMDHRELMLMNANMLDRLTSEQQDIVAWEIKHRELSILRKRNINPSDEYNYVKLAAETNSKISTVPSDPTALKYRLAEGDKLEGMTDELLNRSREIIENTVVEVSSDKLHSVNGGGVNMLANKYMVEDSNGEKIVVDNRRIQEHFRKLYMKKMSEITGIDYTTFDEEPDLDLFPQDIPEDNNTFGPTRPFTFDMDDYEDD